MCKMKFLVTVTLLQINLVLISGQGDLYAGDKCSITNGKTGICKFITQCPEVMENLKKGIFPQQCGFEGTQVIVCCPKAKPSITASRQPGVISNEKCAEYSKYVWKIELNPTLLVGGGDIRINECPFNRQQLIVGGEAASRREFPHMVQFGYDGSDDLVWTCGGSLISDQFVLTAAHCLSDISLGDPKYARMGIVDLEDDDHKQQYNILKLIPYPKYEAPSHYHDIGLVKLQKKVELNTWVRPACLYTNNSSPRSNVIASGWGTTFFAGSQSTILLRVVLELYNQTKCNRTYKQEVGTGRLMDGIKDDIMICAGHSKEIRDTCQGDSGGPLQVYRDGEKDMSCMYDIVGVTSYGKGCGIATNIPAVYTRISHYIKWIEDIVWPQR